MDFYEVIKKRRSIRKYKQQPIPQEVLSRIMEAVRLAPSACNLQPFKFLIISSKEKKKSLKGVIQDWALDAPLLVVALGNKKQAWRRDGESVHQIDVAIAVEHLVLAATAEGLGTCWILAYDRKAVSDALNIPEEWEPVAVVPVGYSAHNLPATPKKEISEIFEII
ncbi:MAG TPA: nitroreductase family protein [Verrucomicrobiota bacterium]|nr:nitroreductase family protein [Verrucomicrobiota bacterium]